MYQIPLKWSKIYQKASICPPSRSKHYKGQWRPQQKNICIFPHCCYSEEGISRTGTKNLKKTPPFWQVFFATHQFRTNVERATSFSFFDTQVVGFLKKILIFTEKMFFFARGVGKSIPGVHLILQYSVSIPEPTPCVT